MSERKGVWGGAIAYLLEFLILVLLRFRVRSTGSSQSVFSFFGRLVFVNGLVMECPSLGRFSSLMLSYECRHSILFVSPSSSLLYVILVTVSLVALSTGIPCCSMMYGRMLGCSYSFPWSGASTFLVIVSCVSMVRCSGFRGWENVAGVSLSKPLLSSCMSCACARMSGSGDLFTIREGLSGLFLIPLSDCLVGMFSWESRVALETMSAHVDLRPYVRGVQTLSTRAIDLLVSRLVTATASRWLPVI